MSEDSRPSRRGVLRTALTMAAGSMIVTVARADDTEDSRVDKSVVQYQDKWNADGAHCAICTIFIAPAACKVVAGTIDPNGYCTAFAPKDAT